jgi:hypothetical protein
MLQHIEKMLVGSTGHVTRDVAGLLDAASTQRDQNDWTDAWVVYPHGEYGWLIRVPGNDDTGLQHPDCQKAPVMFFDIMALARRMGCEWVLLDRDAAPIGGLKSYDW